MKVAILGAGNAGSGVAADLSLRGHNVALIKTSHSMHDKNFNYLLENDGRIQLLENGETKKTQIQTVSRDLNDIKDAEVIIVYIQSTYHEVLLKRLVPLIRKGQILLFNPGYLSTAYALKYSEGRELSIVEATSSFIDCRIIEPGVVKVSFRNVRNPLGIYPKERTTEIKEKLKGLGYPFHYFSSVIEAGLHNPNLIVHTLGAIMSIPQIENQKEKYDMYGQVFTPSVWKILEKLDGEKMDVLESLGYERLSYVEACKLRNTLDDTVDAKEAFFEYAHRPQRVRGPFEVDARYISEDVPQGLVMLESFGKALDIKTPITSSLIEIASAALGRNLRHDGRTIHSLSREHLRKIMKNAERE